jgi:hypothetical protein
MAILGVGLCMEVESLRVSARKFSAQKPNRKAKSEFALNWGA